MRPQGGEGVNNRTPGKLLRFQNKNTIKPKNMTSPFGNFSQHHGPPNKIFVKKNIKNQYPVFLTRLHLRP